MGGPIGIIYLIIIINLLIIAEDAHAHTLSQSRVKFNDHIRDFLII